MIKLRRQLGLLILLAQTLMMGLMLTNCSEIDQATTQTPTRTPVSTTTPYSTTTPESTSFNYSLVGRNLDGWYPEMFTFVIGDAEYTVNRTGNALRVGDSGIPQTFSLPMEFPSLSMAGIIEQPIGYTIYQDNLLLFYKGEIPGKTGYGYLVLFDNETLSVLWQALIPSFNVGKPLFRNRYIYVTSIGFIGKIDLTSGAYVWKHDGLYDGETQDFNSFREPVIENGQVVFQGSNPSDRPAKRVEVDDDTGEILGIYTTQD